MKKYIVCKNIFVVVSKAAKKGRTVEDIEEPLMHEIHYHDKLIDELAKGKSMDKICRG